MQSIHADSDTRDMKGTITRNALVSKCVLHVDKTVCILPETATSNVCVSGTIQYKRQPVITSLVWKMHQE